jgi:hypothetical protein
MTSPDPAEGTESTDEEVLATPATPGAQALPSDDDDAGVGTSDG